MIEQQIAEIERLANGRIHNAIAANLTHTLGTTVSHDQTIAAFIVVLNTMHINTRFTAHDRNKCRQIAIAIGHYVKADRLAWTAKKDRVYEFCHGGCMYVLATEGE